MAIQPSDVQYKWSNLRGEEVEVGRLYDDGFLFLKDDPGVLIESNPDIVSSVRSLELDLFWYEGDRIGDSIGELSQLTHLSIYGGFCNLKCLPNTLSRLHNLHHLELDDFEDLEDLPPNFGDLYNLTYLCLRPCRSLNLIESVAKLSNLTTLVISQLEELPPNLGGLYNLKSLSLYYCGNYVIESVTKLSNLTTLIISGKKLEELPANLGDLKFLASLFLDGCYRLRCLPWSITKLSNLRFLYLHEEFRLETLPPHLNDSIIISVPKTHIRKTWKELKTQLTEFPIITEELAAQKTSTPGYLRFKGDPTLWIRHYNNYGLHSSVRVLDVDLGDWSCKGKIPDSIGELSQLTHLYISNGCLSYHLPPTFSRLTHLSLIECTFECHTISHFDSLGNLSTLTSLHLCPDKLLPEHMDLPISLTHLTLEWCHSSNLDCYMARMGKLSNLNTLTLSWCGDLESLPLHLNLTKLILRQTTIKSLPIGLKHLEIIHVICWVGKSCSKLQECWRNQLVNLETLSFTCSEIKSLLSLTSLHNLRELQLKDCFNLRELPPDLDKLVNLCTLNVSGTRIKSLPDSIINLHKLRRLILPKCFILKSLPDDFGNKVMISVDDTDESYYKHQRYHEDYYGIIKDCDHMTSDSINEINEKFLELFKQATVIEQASPHRPSNHQPDATRIIEGSQFNGSTDPTSNNNPNAFISSPNHEIENLLTSNEAGTIPVVVNEYCSDVNPNTMQDHDPMDIEGNNNAVLQYNNRDGVVTDIAAEPSSKLHETNSSGLRNQIRLNLEYIADILESKRGTSSIGSFKGQDNIYQRGGGVQHKTQKIRGKISLDRINELKSQNLTLEVAASKEHLGDPTSNDNPNAFISSPNHEIKNLPTSNEAGTIPFVVNEYYSDVNANTMQVPVPKKLAAFNTDIPNFPYRNNIPAVIMDYLVGWNDVEADGNCGFRCVAEVFHGGQENWPMARQAILNELKAHPDVYQTIYCDDYDSALQRIDWNDGQCGEDHYMEIVTDLYPIANCYQCPVMCFTMTADGSNPQFSVTVFPWNVAAHSTGPTKEVTIAHLGKCKHYILLDLKDDFPVPPVSTLWNGIKDETVDWDSQYATKRQRWDRLTNRSRDSTHLDVSDDCNVNGGNSVVGENISHGHAYFNKGIEIQTLNSSRKGVVVTSVNLELAIGTAFAPALCKSQNSVKGGSNNHALVIGQHKKSQTGNVKHNNQRIEISRESINTLRSEGLTLEKAAEHFNVSKTTLKRRLKEYKITWKSSKKRKTLYTNSKMMPSKQSGRILSQINLVDPSNPTRQGQMELAGPSQLASTLGQGMEHPIGQKHPTLSDIETIDSKDADPQQLEEIISQFGYIIINKSTEFHTYGHQRVEEPLNGDKAGRNLSGSQLMINLVDPSNPTSHGQGMEHLAEPSQPALFNRAIHGQGVEHLGGPSQPALFNPASHGQGVEHLAGPSQPILSYHVPSERNVVNNLTLDVVTRPDFEVKATYDEDTVCFRFSWSSSFEQLKEEVGKRFELEVGKFKMRYHDEIDWILVTCISDLERALGFSKPPESNVVKLSIALK